MTPLRNTKKDRLHAIAIGCATVLLALGIVETTSFFALRLNGGEPRSIPTSWSESAIERSLEAPETPPPSPDRIEPLSPEKPEASWQAHLEKQPEPMRDCALSTSYLEEIGEATDCLVFSKETFMEGDFLRHRPNVSNQNSCLMIGDELIYRSSYRIDEFGRRMTTTPKAASPEYQSFLTLFGGSFVFGQGVEDHQTIASELQAQLPSVHVYNYGISGAALGTVLADLRARDLKKEITERRGAAIYFYSDYDFLRIVPAFQESLEPEIYAQAFLEENADGKIELASAQRWDFALRFGLYRLLAQSQTVRYLNLDFPMPTAKHLRLFAKTLAVIQEEMKEKVGVERLIVVPLPDNSNFYFAHLRAELARNGISYIDLSRWHLEELLTDRPYYPCDNHPTPKAYRYIADHLAKILKDSGAK